MKLFDLNHKGYILTPFQQSNAVKLLEAVTLLEGHYGASFLVTSGIRTKEDQDSINPGVKNSAHLSGEAVDISDPDSHIWRWLMDNLDFVIQAGIYLESKTYTRRWVHLQTRIPVSKNRIFIP